MTQKRKTNPLKPNLERAARKEAAQHVAPAKPTGQKALARALALRAQEMIDKGVAAPSIIAGNAIALSRGAQPLDFERLTLAALPLDESARKALTRVMGGWRLPGSSWADALIKEFDLQWSPQKPAAPAHGGAHARQEARPGADKRQGEPRRDAAPARRPVAQKAASTPVVVIKRPKRLDAPAPEAPSGPQGEAA
jgi:hypothetical protein